MIGLNVLIPIMLMKIISLFSEKDTASTHTSVILLLYGFLWTLSQFTALLREVFLFKAVERSVRLICHGVSAHIHRLSYNFYTTQKTGALLGYIEKTYKAFPCIFWGFTLSVIPTIIEVIIATSIIWYLYGYLLGLTLIGTLFIFIIFSIVTTEWTSRVQSDSNENHFGVNAYLVDGLINFSLIRYFGSREFESKQINWLLKKREDTEVRSQLLMQYVRLGQAAIIGLSLTLITYLSGKNVIAKDLSIPDFILINSYVLQFSVPLFFFGFIFKDMRKGLTDMEQLANLLKKEPAEIEKNCYPSKVHLNEKYDIRFKNVNFTYDNNKQVFTDMNFYIPSGKTIALVGPSGSGKSTIPNLIFRFYDINSGQILIGENDIKEFSLDNLTDIVGIVPQHTNLFNNTILYNVCYGTPSASEEDIEKAIKIVQLDTLIEKLPHKLLTLIGERGLNLSEGEKQRISIARLILKKPKIYIFDESTSSLDLKTEREIQNSLKKITQGATCLIIAHRLSTIMEADNIFVLNKGIIAEEGTHSELINLKGIYFNLWSSQSHPFDELYSHIS